VIGFGLRLAVASGREAVARLVVIAAAVAVGVGLLVATLAGINAVDAQNARYAWLNTGAAQDSGSPAADPLWWRVAGDYFHGQSIGRVDVAATGPGSPVPPGIPRLPGPGEFYASPALGDLLASTPAEQLGDRFPGRQVGTIGPSALPAPNSLIVVIGHTPAELSGQDRAVKVTSISTTSPSECGSVCFIGIDAAGMDLILAVVAGALLFPLLIFIGTATRLAATRREQRFAAMRLVGATPRQVSVISAVESTVSAIAGTAVGFGVFFLCRGSLAKIPFTGDPFFPTDLSLNWADVLLVALGVPLGAALAARIALRRVRISPLGVTRRVTPGPPRAYRLIPLAAGLAELAYFVGRRPETTNGQVQAFLGGILVTMVGLVVAGPWLTMVGARVLAQRTRRVATLIAARRLADNPHAGFRAVSGLVLALFVTTVAVSVIGTISADRDTPSGGSAASNLIQFFRNDHPAAGTDQAPAGLTSIPGVHGVAFVHAAPDAMARSVPPRVLEVVGKQRWRWAPSDLASCADLARTSAFGRCAPGAEVAWVFPDFSPPGVNSVAGTVWPTADVTVDDLRRLPLRSLVVDTDGSKATIEQARTQIEAAYREPHPPFTVAESNADNSRTLNGWKQLANVVILASLAIAGCSLAVSVAGGLSERKRPFSMLRLTGVPLDVLRRVVALESGVTLLTAAVVAAGTGFLAAHLFLEAQMGYSLRMPGVAYYGIVLAGLAASVAIIASTLPLLRRITGPETARNE
jgi:hypothetical protein